MDSAEMLQNLEPSRALRPSKPETEVCTPAQLSLDTKPLSVFCHLVTV